jgi:thiamine pyrophosphate-dependent acetolactate synthase large subunit-like protein
VAEMSGGEAVVEALRREGATHAFGVIGTAMLEVFDALYDAEDITYVGVRHEQNAVHMADGFARVAGRAGVVLAGQPGPGATNLVTGLAEAKLSFSPVVTIAGDTTSQQVDRGTFQEVDQQALFAPITKRTLTVHSPDRIPEYVQEAFRTSHSGRRGPVVVNVPGNFLGLQVAAEFAEPDAARPSAGPAPARAAASAAAELINQARRPVIVAGAGVKWSVASRALSAFAEYLNIPVVASAGNGDVIPNDHPLYIGQVGPRGNPVATGLVAEADVILALGTRLGYNTTTFSSEVVAPTAKVVHVDVEATAVGRHFPVAVGIVADAAELIGALRPLTQRSAAWDDWVAGAQRARRQLLEQREQAAAAPSSDGLLAPGAIISAVQRGLPRNAIVTVDTGACSLFATDTIQTFEPPALLTPLDFGLVGFSYAAGLGAKAAAPARPVLSLIGDGGFGMAMCELGTAVAAGLGTVTVVLNNGCWGAEKAYQRDYFDGRYLGADIVNPAFDQVARAFGVTGVRPDDPDGITDAVHDSVRDDAPAVIEVMVDPDAITSFRRDSFPNRVKATA